MRTRLFLLLPFIGLLLAGCAPIVAPDVASNPATAPAGYRFDDQDRRRVVAVESLGMATFPTGTTFADTEVGGLSAVVYDPAAGLYYILSDDRSQRAPARIYTAQIDLADGRLDEGDVLFQDVITLTDATGAPYAAGSLNPEGLALAADGRLFLSSEGDTAVSPPILPFVDQFNLNGEHVAALTIPATYLPTTAGDTGVRPNRAFESLSITPDQQTLVTGVENALLQDGPAADLDQESPSRVLVYDLAGAQPVHEMVYIVDAVPVAPEPASGDRDNGLSDLLTLDNNGTFLALERNYSEGVGNSIRLYEANTQGALDVLGVTSLSHDGAPYEIDPPIAKRLIADLSELGLDPDNVEGMAFGPILPDGRQSLILVSDNNFNPAQTTQIIALALSLQTLPAVQPRLETANVMDSDEAIPEGELAGDADDPAIWVHPSDPGQSLVIATLKDGGLVVFDLDGQITQTFAPDEYGAKRYNNVDLLYNFDLDGTPVDLAIASDRANDTLAVFAIDPATRRLTDVTAPEMPATVFGIDDGEQTVYGLATWTEPATGTPYVFVTQREGNQVAQLALTPNGNGQVTAAVVRALSLPQVSDDLADSQSEGMVVDRDAGILYIAMENGEGIFKFAAAPEGGNDPEPLAVLTSAALLPDVEGLTIYYGPDGDGYLLASSQGDSTYAVFARSGDNAYLGNFVIAGVDGIDQTNESDGADLVGLPLGPAYPAGLLVVQDGANDPQIVAEDEGALENITANFKFVPWDAVATAIARLQP